MQNLFNNFSEVKVLVYGDIMLDQYWWGNVERMSPEAPVPVVNLHRKSLVIGGAANVAANIVGLGATPILFGGIGFDAEGEKFRKLLNDKNISSDNIYSLENRQTTTKTRIIGQNQQIVRIDQESNHALVKTVQEKVWTDLEKAFDDADVILISDYAKGFVTEETTSRLITKSIARNKIILIDPKGKNYNKYKNATVITPNEKEALIATKFENGDDKTIKQIGNKLLKDISLEALIITRGEKGMTLFQKGKELKHLNASARKVYDVTGAGDTVIATLAVAIGSGATFYDAANLANLAGGIVVEEMGTTVIGLAQLKKSLLQSKPISTLDVLQK